MFYRDERLALLIDGANLYAAARALVFDIDYKLLRTEFMRRGKLLRAFYYTALLESEEYSPIRPLVDWLNYNGFAMVTKPAPPLRASSESPSQSWPRAPARAAKASTGTSPIAIAAPLNMAGTSRPAT